MDGDVVLNPGSGGAAVDAEKLAGAGPGGVDLFRERCQIAGAIIAEVARVLNTSPTNTDYGLVVRALLSQLPAALVAGRLDVNIGTSLPAGTNTIGKADQGAGGVSAWKVDGSAVTQPVLGTITANQGGAPWAISAAALPLPANAAQEHAAAAAPSSTRLSDGAAFYDAAKTGQLPTALVGGRLDDNVGSWLGSTAPTIGQKVMAASVPMAIASDQSNVPVSIGAALPVGANTIGKVDQGGAAALASAWPTKVVSVDGTRTADVNTGNALQTTGLVVPSGSFMPLSFGALITSPAWPDIKPLSSYFVPTGKTLKIFGFAVKTAAVTTYMFLLTRTLLWKFAAVVVATPAAPILVAKTITGGGLTALATYRYKIVAVNNVGKTIGSAEVSVTLTGTQNAVTLTMVLPAGTMYLEIYRTAANGAVNSEVFLQATEATSLTDVIPDTELGTVTPPAANTTAGSADGDAYPALQAAGWVEADTLAAITTATAVDVIYKDAYGKRRYLTFTSQLAAGAQQELLWAGLTNPAADNRIPRLTVGQEFIASGINDILNIGNTPVTGSFNIYGYNHVFYDASSIANSWDVTMFPAEIAIAAGTEVVLGTSAGAAVVTAARNDLIVFATLV